MGRVRLRVMGMVSALAISAVASMLLGVPLHSVSAHPTNSVVDPLVVIAVDGTTPDCSATFDINESPHYPGLPHAQRRIVTFACPAGTVMKPVTLRRSQAVALHLRYVELPDASASAATKQEVDRQIAQLLAQSAEALLRAAKIPAISSSTCGWTSTASWNWTLFSMTYTSKVKYYRSLDCSKVALDTSAITSTDVYPFNFVYWQHDQYGAGWWWVPGCPFLSPSGSLGSSQTWSYSINEAHTPNLYFINYVGLEHCYGTVYSIASPYTLG